MGLAQARRTHCLKGHPLAGDNLLLVHRRRGGHVYVERICRTCHRARFRAWYRRLFHGAAA